MPQDELTALVNTHLRRPITPIPISETPERPYTVAARVHDIRYLFAAAYAKYIIPRGWSFEDLLNDLYCKLLEHERHGTYDPSRCAYSKWVLLNARSLISHYAEKPSTRQPTYSIPEWLPDKEAELYDCYADLQRHITLAASVAPDNATLNLAAQLFPHFAAGRSEYELRRIANLPEGQKYKGMKAAHKILLDLSAEWISQ